MARHQNAILALILVVGILISFALFSFVRYWESSAEKTDFEQLAESQELALQNVIRQNLDVIEYIYNFFLSSNTVTSDEFHAFLEGPIASHNAIIKVGWAPVVSEHERASFEAGMNEEGLKSFQVTEKNGYGISIRAAERSEYTPLIFVEPREVNDPFIGLDLGGEAIYQEVLHKARDSGEAITTRRISIEFEGRELFGIAIIKPVYRKEVSLQTVAERRDHIIGYLYELIDIGTLIGGATVSWGIFSVNLSLIDESAPSYARALFHYDSDTRSVSTSKISSRDGLAPQGPLQQSSTLELPGRQWSLIITPGKEFYTSHSSRQSWIVLITGLILSTLLCVFQSNANKRTREITELASGLTSANGQLEAQVEKRRHIEHALEEVAGAVSSTTGDEFFRTLVKNLTNTLGIDIAFIAKREKGSEDSLETIAACVSGEIVDNFQYSLVGTPCGDVYNNEACFFPENIQRNFPQDHLLMEMGVESYIGVPLFDINSDPLGIVVVLGYEPMKSRQPAEAIMKIFAARIVAELQHKKARDEIQGLIKFPDENPSPVIRASDDGIILYANRGSEYLLASWGCQTGEKLPPDIFKICKRCLKNEKNIELDFSCGDREYSFMLAPSIESHYINIYALDITERQHDKAQMSKLSGALEKTGDSVMITDLNGIIEYVNPAFEKTTGYSAAEAIGAKTNILKSGRHDHAFYQKLWATILSGEVYRDVLVNRKKDGTLYYEEKSITPLKSQYGNITNFISTGMDITERMQAEERLHHLAYHDVLTDLPNRALFMERLSHALLQRHSDGEKLAVLFLDVDRFKTINDTLGHESGDRFLQSFTRLLLNCVRTGDTVARFGGDEFAILLENINSIQAVSGVAEKINHALTKPFRVDGPDLYVTTSIGICLYPDDGDNPNILLKHADSAMYQAKEQGRNNYKYYSDEMSAQAYRRMALEVGLRTALDRDQFFLNYQPQIDIRSDEIIGAEALLRWEHPELGLVNPMEFIPILEEIGLIIEVGEWVLRTACRQAKSWNAMFTNPFRVAVNISGKQFSNADLKGQVLRIIEETDLDPHLLELEITESVLMQDDKSTMVNLIDLHDYGMKLSIDDFGTGYSSLSYLKRFPVDCLKIDRSFVRDITSDPDDATIVGAIIAMAHRLNLEVVAEGVETEAQLEFLRQGNCDIVQGYFYSKPVDAGEFQKILVASQFNMNKDIA